MILEIDNVELYYSNKRVLNGIYLKAEIGKVTGILGRNGCGKSSLLRIIFGDLKPKYKLVRVNNQPILKPLYETQLIGLLPQHSLVPNSMKLNTVFKLMKVNWSEFVAVFKFFSPYRNKSINILSGGERRILETYLILSSDKKIVLLDEPFSHLAPLYIEKFKKLIKMEKQNKAIILTDHYFKDVINSSDDLYLLHNGCTKRIQNIEELKDYSYLGLGHLT